MNIKITEYEKIYSFELHPITQLCGQNIVKKSYILDSLRRYFSTFKYSEGVNRWRDNVKIDENAPGRKYFEINSIGSISDIRSEIKWKKAGILNSYVEHLLQAFDLQSELNQIDQYVQSIMNAVNENLKQLGDIELIYHPSELWEMVQKTEVCAIGELGVDEKSNFEMFNIYLHLLENMVAIHPKNTILILENLDHLLSINEYRETIDTLKSISQKYPIYFLITTSLDNYVVIDEELCSGISICNDEDFQMEELDQTLKFIKSKYPNQHHPEDAEIIRSLNKVIHRIGKREYLTNVHQNVICKLINETILLKDSFPKDENVLELAFLKN